MENSKIFLQVTTASLAVIPLSAGAIGVLYGPALLVGELYHISFDSHLRYLSGLLLGIGLAFLTCVPRIETKSERFLLLTAIVFTGGLARLLSLIITGVPSSFMLGGLAMELVITPLLCLWQRRVAKNY